MKKVLITGPTGAIGIALIDQLIKMKIGVVAICHRGSARIINLPKSELVQVVSCDLSELKQLPQMLEKEDEFDYFVHLAWDGAAGDARNNIKLQIDNIRYTLDAVEVAAQLGCRRFIGAGSQAEYGRCDEVIIPKTPVFPENGYGMAKLCSGQMSRLRCNQLGIEHIWMRIFSVYGPCDGDNTLISMLIKKLKAKEHISCTKAEQIWDYMFSADVANAIIALMNEGVSGKVYTLACGESHPLKYYIEIIKDLIDPKAIIGYGEIPYNDKQVMNLKTDISELVNDTGFKVETDFATGIKCILNKQMIKMEE